MTTNIFVIQDDVFLLYEVIYNNNIYFSLYKKIYDDSKRLLLKYIKNCSNKCHGMLHSYYNYNLLL